MPMPRSRVRVTKNGDVKFISNRNKIEYTLQELTRAAYRDIAKIISRQLHEKVESIAGGSLRGFRRVKRAWQYWNRKKSLDLVIGIKHDTWYGVDQELGTDGQPKRDILRSTVIENIDLIEQIQAQYLKHVEDERTARSLIDENAEVASDDQDA